MNKIILASGSPRRRELLEQIGIPFEVVTSNAAEVTSAVQPDEIVKELSKIKAEAVAQICKEKGELYQEAVILGADTIVYHNGKVLGKPKSEEDAYSMIESLAGKEHFVYTGVTILTPNKQICFAEAVKVSVYEMSAEEIKSYIATGEPMDKAGAYGIQGRFAAFVKGISGDYNAVVGLPVARVYQELKNAGVL